MLMDAVLLTVPGPLSFVVIACVVLNCIPDPVAVTFTEMLHEEFAATLPPERLIDVAVTVTVPPQVLVKPVEVAVIPPGSGSLKATPLRLCEVFGLVMAKDKVVLSF